MMVLLKRRICCPKHGRSRKNKQALRVIASDLRAFLFVAKIVAQSEPPLVGRAIRH